MRQTWKLAVTALSLLALMTGCASGGDSSKDDSSAYGGGTAGMTGEISVISREEGSGTRTAFIELFGVEEKDASGNKVDHTTEEANITNNTSVMMTTVAGDPKAIGYISLGSLNDTVKALKIDGTAPTVANVKAGTYGISRPFNIITKDESNKAAQDFIKFIMSTDGQKIVEDSGYIPQETSESYSTDKPAGKVSVAGSSSVSPVMEKLKEGYAKVNPNAKVEIQTSDSTTGVTSTIDGTCDIGMASRAIKDTESAKGVRATVIATDGIAVIVNKDNSMDDLSKDQIKNIFTGDTTDWSDVG